MEVNPIAGGNRAKSGVADNLCGASKRGRCAVNQPRTFRAGLHTMYVEAFAGAIAAVLDKGQHVQGLAVVFVASRRSFQRSASSASAMRRSEASVGLRISRSTNEIIDRERPDFSAT